MHLFKQFWRLLSRNRFGIILYSIIGLAMIIIAGMAVKDQGATTDESGQVDIGEALDISYVDNDDSELSHAFIEYLSRNNNVSDYKDKEDEEINDLLYFEIVTFHIEIPEGLQAKADNGEDVNVEYKTSIMQSSYAYKIENLINSYVNVYSMYMDQGMDSKKAIEKTNSSMDQELNISVYHTSEKPQGSNPKEYVIFYISTYITYISFSMVAMSVGRTIIVSNNENVTSRIAASPVSESKRTLINTIGLYSFSLILLVIYVIGIYAYAGDTYLVKERGILLIINTFIILLYNSSITAVIASLRVKGNTISMIVNVIGLSMSFLSGVFVPQWMLGENVINIAKIFPFYWSVQTLTMIYPECGAGLTFDINKIYGNFGITILYAIVFAMGSVLIMKMKKK